MGVDTTVMDELFPLFLKLAGRRCVVVGGGTVAEAKMQGLLRCGAEVRVVAPEVTPGIRDAASAGHIAVSYTHLTLPTICSV